MKPLERHPISAALISLREAIGKTQQEFAVEVLKSSIVTVARYETSHPPRGDTLLRLAEIADSFNQPELAATFRQAFGQEIAEKLGRSKGFITFEPRMGGFMAQSLENDAEVRYAYAFAGLLDDLSDKERAPTAKKILDNMQSRYAETANKLGEQIMNTFLQEKPKGGKRR